MELLLFLVPGFIHGWLMGDISFTKTEEDRGIENFKIGVDLYKKGKIVESLRYFEGKLKLLPKSAYLYYYIGKCHYHFENYEAALLNFDYSLRFDTTIIDVYFHKAHCHYYLEDWGNAYFQAEKASRFFREKNNDLLFLKNESRKRSLLSLTRA